MTTTIHIPPALPAALDARARARGVSRNQLIVQVLEKSLDEGADWDPEFLENLRKPVDDATAQELDQVMELIVQRRTSKPPLECE